MAKRKPKARRDWGEGRIEELPSGKWRAVISGGRDPITGKRLRPSKTFPTKAEAIEWKSRQQAARGQGDAGRSWTLAGWAEHWLQVRKGEIDWSTWRKYNQHLRVYAVPKLGTVKLADLSRVTIDRWRADLAALPVKPVPPGQIFRATKTLKQCLGDAVEAGVLARNPVGKVRRPKSTKSAIHPLTVEQAREFLRVAAGTHFEALWRLALDSGARPGELLALHWPDVDFAAGSVHVHRTLECRDDGSFHLKPPKTPKADRVILVAPATVAALRDHRDKLRKAGHYSPDGRVFPAPRGGFISVAGLSENHWGKLKKLAALPVGVRMYDLRHTSATLLVQAGESLRVVADRLGHEDPSITLKSYIKYMPDQQASARDRIQGLFG